MHESFVMGQIRFTWMILLLRNSLSEDYLLFTECELNRVSMIDTCRINHYSLFTSNSRELDTHFVKQTL